MAMGEARLDMERVEGEEEGLDVMGDSKPDCVIAKQRHAEARERRRKEMWTRRPHSVR